MYNSMDMRNSNNNNPIVELNIFCGNIVSYK